MNKKIKNFLAICFIYLLFYLIPISMAVLGALYKLSYSYYLTFKIVMVYADSGVFNFIHAPSHLAMSDTTEKIYLVSCIVTLIITMLGIISETTSGFSRDFWIVLDYIYATAKIIQLIIVIKGKAFV